MSGKPTAFRGLISPVLQEEIGAWHRAKFGEVDPSKPLLVAVGEIGELAQSHVKAEQGHLIRYRGTDYDAQSFDAVGDIVIALVAYCARRGWDFDSVVETVWEEVSQRFEGESAHPAPDADSKENNDEQ